MDVRFRGLGLGMYTVLEGQGVELSHVLLGGLLLAVLLELLLPLSLVAYGRPVLESRV